ncbi:MAG: phosphoribosylglycinamide formyltransferase [Hyphomicrobiaceae bacterium]|nr:phosphoribosylglycinamide formyltransferase [Hyphomicrobiaceae bacterium]
MSGALPALPPLPPGGKRRVGVLLSGRGSNMMALVEAARAPGYPAEIAVVIANRPDAGGLAWARGEAIPAHLVDHKAFANRETFERAVDAVLIEAGVEIVALAGFMRLMTPWLVERWRDRMLNIHPSLLPSFKGLDTHARALEAGVRIAGCTVHLVREAMDEGPILGQAAVPVAPGDTPDTLAARVLAAEHLLYPAVLAGYCSGAITFDGAHVRFASTMAAEGPDMLMAPAQPAGS